MGYGPVVKILKRATELFNPEDGLLLSDFSFFLEAMVQSSAFKILEKQVDMFVIIENSIQFDNIGMLHPSLNLDFEQQLI